MIRMVKHKGKDYIIINTTFSNGDIQAPIQVQINLGNVDPKHHNELYWQAAQVFNKAFKIKVIDSKKNKDIKPWWKRLF